MSQSDDDVPLEVLAYYERLNRRERRFIAIFSIPFGSSIARRLWLNGLLLYGLARRFWNRLRYPKRFVWRCVYCDKPTAQAPSEHRGNRWPSCCSRLRCLNKWEPEGGWKRDDST